MSVAVAALTLSEAALRRKKSYSVQVTEKTSQALIIPAFPIEAILAGLAGGFVSITLIRRRRCDR